MRFLAERLDLVGGVGSHGEEADEGRARITLPPRGLQVQDDRVRVARTHGVGNVLTGLGDGPVRGPRPGHTDTHLLLLPEWKRVGNALLVLTVLNERRITSFQHLPGGAFI
jgi:hypothetical protein